MTQTIPCRKAFTDALLANARLDSTIIAVSTDARGSVTLTDFAKELPAQFVEVGIAEQNAVGLSAGLASTGKKVFVCGPACFYVARALEQVKVDVAYSGFNVAILGVSGGISYGALGATHHSLHDLAVLRTFPGLSVVLPCDIHQTRQLVSCLLEHPRPVYIRVGRNAVPDVYTADNAPFTPGIANCLMDGEALTLIGTGETVWHCLEAGKQLAAIGVRVRVLDMHTIKPLDEEAIIRAARETGRLLTVEEHSVFGGLGAAVAEVVVQQAPVPMKLVGIPDENAPAGSSPQLFRHYGLDADSLVQTVLNWINH